MKRYLSLVEVEWGGKRMYWTMQVCFFSVQIRWQTLHTQLWLKVRDAPNAKSAIYKQSVFILSPASAVLPPCWRYPPPGGKVEAFRQTNTVQSNTAVRNLASELTYFRSELPKCLRLTLRAWRGYERPRAAIRGSPDRSARPKPSAGAGSSGTETPWRRTPSCWQPCWEGRPWCAAERTAPCLRWKGAEIWRKLLVPAAGCQEEIYQIIRFCVTDYRIGVNVVIFN